MCQKFDNALGVLLLSQPFFATLALKFDIQEAEDISTLAVNSRQIRYNPKFLAGLTDDEVVFCVAHEVMHVAWKHLPRLEAYHNTGIGPDGKPYDHDRMNRACDYVGNAMLVNMKVGAAPTKLQICLDPARYPDSMSPEQVYTMLEKDEKSRSGGGPGGQVLDEHDFSNPGESVVKPVDIVQAAQRHSMVHGSLPGSLQRLVDEIKRPAESPWDILRRAVSRATSGRDATSWNRLNRKLLVRGIGAPGRVSHRSGHIAVVTDVSGSVDQAMVNLFAGHLAAIIEDARPELVSVLWTDTEVRRVDTLREGTDLIDCMRKRIPGGGGTDMPKGVRKAERMRADFIVVLTDGYTPFCDSGTETIWAITTPGVKAPHGTTLYIGGDA